MPIVGLAMSVIGGLSKSGESGGLLGGGDKKKGKEKEENPIEKLLALATNVCGMGGGLLG
jgi:hypothetical protein